MQDFLFHRAYPIFTFEHTSVLAIRQSSKSQKRFKTRIHHQYILTHPQTWRCRHCTAGSASLSTGCTWARRRRRRAAAGART